MAAHLRVTDTDHGPMALVADGGGYALVLVGTDGTDEFIGAVADPNNFALAVGMACDEIDALVAQAMEEFS